jgi:hypothetical protein
VCRTPQPCGPGAVQNASFGGKVNVRIISGPSSHGHGGPRQRSVLRKLRRLNPGLPRAVRQTRDEARIAFRHPSDDPAGRLAAVNLEPLRCGALAPGSEPRAGSSITLVVTK